MDEVFGLFPIPFLRARGTLPAPLVARLVEHFSTLVTNDNNSSANLAHTEMLTPKDSPLLTKAAELIAPKLVDFGAILFGERLRWLMKEMWVNVCGAEGLKGTFTIEGIGKRYSAALVKIFWLDGKDHVYTLTGAQQAVQLYGSADDNRGGGEIARAYIVLGIEHILSGIDHLLFVAGLLFLVGFRRRLVGTVSAFTLAHSLTLACSVFGLISLRPAPVEAAIAMSIVLVASEALRERDTLARRLPALVAFLFGLVHGLGFAGALKSVGLPQRHLPLALLCFNVGVELGQLLVVLVTFAIVRLPVSQRWLGRARRPALYAIGIVAAYWSWLRIAALAVATR